MKTLEEVKMSDKLMLVPADIAPLIGCSAYAINLQAKDDPSKLGFPCSLIGTRVRIPRAGFIAWMEGRMTTP